ncbi:oligosaccharide flippase family protein [Flavobacterium sp. LB1P62]|uniref:oligosaccharide flippase family protein n=1 Tax=Flavobacterium sp. LB1P62 TaxID=3401715 RepID=UPI003AB01E61
MKKIIFSNIVYSLLIVFFGLAGSILISRSLGPSQRGEIAAIILWPTLLLYLGSFGTYQAVIYHFSKSNRKIENIWGSCLVITILNSIISIIVGIILIFLSLKLLSIEYKWYSFYLLLFLPLNIITQFISSILQAKSLFKEYNFTRLFTPLFYLIGILVLYFFKYLTVINIIILQIILIVLQFIVFGALYNKRVGSITNFKYHKKTIKIIYNYGYKVWLGDLSQGLNVKMDQILISGMLLSKDLGIYVVATSIANFTTIIPNAYKTVFLPLISSTKLMVEKLKLTNKVLFNFLWINLGVTIACLIINPYIIPILFGDEFNEAVLISYILLIGFLFFNFKIVLASIMQGVGKPLFVSYSEIFGLVSLLLVIYPLTNSYGLIGASIAISFAYLIQFLTLFLLFIKIKKKNN